MNVPQRVEDDDMTADEYLAYEETASVRHEFVKGRLHAMTGASRVHVIIAGNIHGHLWNALRGSKCRVYMSDLKVRVEATNCFYYPDITVACDDYTKESVFTTQPVLIMEVLSPSTAAIDRREKLLSYQQLPSLKEYIIVHQRKARIEVYRRHASGEWLRHVLGKSDLLELRSLPCSLNLPLEAIYENVDYSAPDGSAEIREEISLYGQEEELVW